MIVPFALETPPYPCPHGRMLQNAYLISNDANKCESSIISFKEMVKFCHFLARQQRCAAETPVLSEMSAGIRKRCSALEGRSEERRGGKECVSKIRTRGWPKNSKKKRRHQKKRKT